MDELLTQSYFNKAKGFEMDLIPLPAYIPELYDEPSAVVDYFERKGEYFKMTLYLTDTS